MLLMTEIFKGEETGGEVQRKKNARDRLISIFTGVIFMICAVAVYVYLDNLRNSFVHPVDLPVKMEKGKTYNVDFVIKGKYAYTLEMRLNNKISGQDLSCMFGWSGDALEGCGKRRKKDLINISMEIWDGGQKVISNPRMGKVSSITGGGGGSESWLGLAFFHEETFKLNKKYTLKLIVNESLPALDIAEPEIQMISKTDDGYMITIMFLFGLIIFLVFIGGVILLAEFLTFRCPECGALRGIWKKNCRECGELD